MKPLWSLLVALLLLVGVAFSAEKTPYRNPILYADVPDMSVCYDGRYYYMISTTMHLMPGGLSLGYIILKLDSIEI